MPFDASKVERTVWVWERGQYHVNRPSINRMETVESSEFDACAAALDETRQELETLRSEATENARIIGMSGSREAALLAEIKKLKEIVEEYRDSAISFLCKRADEVVKERT